MRNGFSTVLALAGFCLTTLFVAPTPALRKTRRRKW